MSEPPAGSNGFKKWVYVGNNNSNANPPAQPEPPPRDANSLSGSYEAPTKAEAAAAIERASRLLASSGPLPPTSTAAPPPPPAPQLTEAPSEAAMLLQAIDQTIARLSSL